MLSFRSSRPQSFEPDTKTRVLFPVFHPSHNLSLLLHLVSIIISKNLQFGGELIVCIRNACPVLSIDRLQFHDSSLNSPEIDLQPINHPLHLPQLFILLSLPHVCTSPTKVHLEPLQPIHLRQHKRCIA